MDNGVSVPKWQHLKSGVIAESFNNKASVS